MGGRTRLAETRIGSTAYATILRSSSCLKRILSSVSAVTRRITMSIMTATESPQAGGEDAEFKV
jgi:hypothetical protein